MSYLGVRPSPNGLRLKSLGWPMATIQRSEENPTQIGALSRKMGPTSH